jgi:hypothetical protein
VAESKWVEFIEMRRTGKTTVWDIVTKDGGVVLGSVKWFGRWRKYSFFPKPDTIYEATCLRDIVAFLDGEMIARRIARIDALSV